MRAEFGRWRVQTARRLAETWYRRVRGYSADLGIIELRHHLPPLHVGMVQQIVHSQDRPYRDLRVFKVAEIFVQAALDHEVLNDVVQRVPVLHTAFVGAKSGSSISSGRPIAASRRSHMRCIDAERQMNLPSPQR